MEGGVGQRRPTSTFSRNRLLIARRDFLDVRPVKYIIISCKFSIRRFANCGRFFFNPSFIFFFGWIIRCNTACIWSERLHQYGVLRLMHIIHQLALIKSCLHQARERAGAQANLSPSQVYDQSTSSLKALLLYRICVPVYKETITRGPKNVRDALIVYR